MNKPWLGYASSIFFLLAGVLMIAGDKLLLGILFIVLAIAGAALRIYMNKKPGNDR